LALSWSSAENSPPLQRREKRFTGPASPAGTKEHAAFLSSLTGLDRKNFCLPSPEALGYFRGTTSLLRLLPVASSPGNLIVTL
jgi:hypothetical protein